MQHATIAPDAQLLSRGHRLPFTACRNYISTHVRRTWVANGCRAHSSSQDAASNPRTQILPPLAELPRRAMLVAMSSLVMSVDQLISKGSVLPAGAASGENSSSTSS